MTEGVKYEDKTYVKGKVLNELPMSNGYLFMTQSGDLCRLCADARLGIRIYLGHRGWVDSSDFTVPLPLYEAVVEAQTPTPTRGEVLTALPLEHGFNFMDADGDVFRMVLLDGHFWVLAEWRGTEWVSTNKPLHYARAPLYKVVWS